MSFGKSKIFPNNHQDKNANESSHEKLNERTIYR